MKTAHLQLLVYLLLANLLLAYMLLVYLQLLSLNFDSYNSKCKNRFKFIIFMIEKAKPGLDMR